MLIFLSLFGTLIGPLTGPLDGSVCGQLDVSRFGLRDINIGIETARAVIQEDSQVTRQSVIWSFSEPVTQDLTSQSVKQAVIQ